MCTVYVYVDACRGTNANVDNCTFVSQFLYLGVCVNVCVSLFVLFVGVGL